MKFEDDRTNAPQPKRTDTPRYAEPERPVRPRSRTYVQAVGPRFDRQLLR